MAYVERRFPAMGSVAHCLVTEGTVRDVDRAEERLAELESKWSRFLPTSEVSTYNDSGQPWRSLDLSADTQRLLRRAEEGVEITEGRFDPWILPTMHAIGYSESRSSHEGPTEFNRSELGSSGTGISDSAVAGGFDPGGLGKGLAADIVVEELMAAGVKGALINVGGDLRAAGESPDGDGWRIDIEDPLTGLCNASIELAQGAVATSTPLKRRWRSSDRECHHLVDPELNQSSSSPVEAVTVVASQAWQAEVLCKLLYLDGGISDIPLRLIERLGCAARVCTPGLVSTSSTWSRFARFSH